MSPLRNELNSIIFICLTPDPKGGHLKIIELGSPLLGDLGGQLLFGVRSIMNHKMTYLQSSPLHPPDKSGQALKGRIASDLSQNKL